MSERLLVNSKKKKKAILKMKVLEDLGIEPGPLALNADMLTTTPGKKSSRQRISELFLKLFHY